MRIPRRSTVRRWSVAVALLAFASRWGIAPAGAQATPVPTPTPAPAASPTAVPHTYVRFVEADLLPGERVANAYTPNRTGSMTNRLRGTLEYKFRRGYSFVEFEYRRWNLDHPAGFVSRPLASTPTFVPAARYTEQDVMMNSSVIGRGHTYLATSTLIHSSSDGDPTLHTRFGFGIERLPDPSKVASLFFSYFYFPEVTGSIDVPVDVSASQLRYKAQFYNVGGAIGMPRSRLFLTAGIVGDRYLRKQSDASDASHVSTHLGIGAHF